MIHNFKYIYITIAFIFCVACSTNKKNDIIPQSIEKNQKYIDDKITETKELKKQSKLAQAVHALDSAIQVAYKTKDYKLYHLLNNKASTLNGLGEEVQALNLFQQSLELARKKNNTLEEFKALANIGILNSRIENYTKALEIFDEAINFYSNSLSQEQKKRYSLGPIYNSKGDIYYQQRKLDSALYYYKLSAKNQDYIIVKHALYNNASNVFRAQKKYDSAHVYINKSIKLAKSQANKSDLSHALINKAKTYISQKKLSEASPLLQQARKNISASNFRLLRNYKKAMVSLLNEKKEYKKAFELQEELIKLNEDVEIEEKNKRVVNLTMLYDLKGKAQKIQNLQLEDELKTIKIDNQRTIILLTLLAIIVLSILMYLYAKKLKHIKELNKNLVSKNLALANSEKKQKLVSESKKSNDSNKKSNKSILNSNRELKQKLIQDLEEFSKNREALCNNDITLSFLAKKLNTNQKYLSLVINEYYNCNFSTFLNERRIRESCLMLTESTYKNYSIEAISKEAGFTSKSAFNKAFKKYTGLTPSVFQKYKKAE